MEMKNTTHYAAERHVFGKTIVAVFALCAWAALLPAQTSKPNATEAYVYWTNYNNGSIGLATIAGADVDQTFIPTTTGGAIGNAGLTVNADYIYWSGANGGTATNVGRASIDGTGADPNFITGGQNPCGVAVNSSYIYWYGDGGSYIGRANLDGSDVNHQFIDAGSGGCGLAVTKSYIYWASYRSGYIGRAKLDGTGVNQNFIYYDGQGIAIEGDYIYYASNGGTGIGRVDLNGSDLNSDFITGLSGSIAFLAVDSKYIFWADSGSDYNGTTIGRASLDGTDVKKRLITGADGPFGIAVTGGNP
jgi:hypothetical protein